MMGRTLHAAHRIKNRFIFLALGLGVVMLAAACSEQGDPWRGPGTYPIDIFPEMHYQQSMKAQEPPRFLPPEGSVPVSGAGDTVLPASKAEAASLANPLTDDRTRAGALLYQINCQQCHGATGGGDGTVGTRFQAYGAPPPPALDSQRMEALSPGEEYWSITNGFGFMPPFGNLLSDEERWAIVQLLEMPNDQRAALLSQTRAPGGLPRN
ncbi:MAG: cytochrome c [SAR202 cluster bacterium]|nr:cytochrome c [SAR202 cluster bacterium]